MHSRTEHSRHLTRYRRAAIAAVAAVAIAVLIRILPPAGNQPYVRTFPVFGTYARLTFYAKQDDAERAADAVQEELQQLHDRINIFDDRSELSRLNHTAFNTPFQCSEALWKLLSVCRRAYAETDGAFDVSVGPLMKLWGFHRKRRSYPEEKDVTRALASVGLDDVLFDDAAREVRFTHPDTYLDMGGVAKVYGLEVAAAAARRHGIRRGLIDLGGNVYCFPRPPPGKDTYTVAIRDPFHPAAYIERVHVLDQCVATSGNYENYAELDGRMVHHIVDPDTGYPVPRVASVTVITPRGVDSDVFSTAVFVRGAPLARRLCIETPRTGIMCVMESDGNTPERKLYNWPGASGGN